MCQNKQNNVKDALLYRVSNLLTIKSMVTLILTLVFAVLALRNLVTVEQFLTIFTVVIGFYFGTQTEKKVNPNG